VNTAISGDSDRGLWDRLRKGDQQAFECIFREHYPALIRFAKLQVRERSEAEDIVHDVFLRIWRDRERLGESSSPRAYLLRAVRNRAIDVLRHRKLVRRWFEPLEQGSRGDAIANLRDGKAQGDAASLAELDAAIREAVADLPERCRTAFLLCRDQGLSYSDAARVMKVSPATVKTQMARALASLKEALARFLVPLVAMSFFAG
jgi:RNA polymerase sigma-70 factor, ECF subfamily